MEHNQPLYEKYKRKVTTYSCSSSSTKVVDGHVETTYFVSVSKEEYEDVLIEKHVPENEEIQEVHHHGKRVAISDELSIEKIEQKSKKNITIGAILGFAAVFVSIAYGIFMTPEIIRVVGITEYGLYGLSSSIINLFILDLGLGAATTTYLAKLRAKGDKEGVERFTAGIFKIYLLLNLVFILVIAALYFLAPVIFARSYGIPGQYVVTHEIQTLQYLFIIIGCFTIISLPFSTFTGVISTYEKFSIIKLLEIIQKLMYLGLTVASVQCKWTIAESGIIPIVVINVTTTILMMLIRLVYMRFYLGIHFDLRLKITRSEKKELLSFSWWGFIVAMCMRLVMTITPTILGVVSDSVAVSVFSIVSTIELYIYTFGTTVSAFFMAKITRAEADGTEEEKRAKMQAVVEKIAKIQFVIITMIIFGFISCGSEFLTFWLGEDIRSGQLTAESVALMYWLVVMISSYEVVHIPTMIFQDEMYTHKKIKHVAFVSLAKVIINIPLSFGLAYYFTNTQGTGLKGAGALGACIAIMVARVSEVIIAHIVYRKHLRISLRHFYKSIYIRGSIGSLIALAVGLGLHFILKPMNFGPGYKMVIIGVAFVITYLICTVFIIFDKEERKYYIDMFLTLLRIKKKPAPIVAVEAQPQEIKENKQIEE